MNNYKNLLVWQKSVHLVELVYRQTNVFPKKEQFGLTQQINRAAVSIPSNIAEGAGRNSEKEFRNFLGIATGSMYELETQLILSNKLGFIDSKNLEILIDLLLQIQKMAASLIKKIESNIYISKD